MITVNGTILERRDTTESWEYVNPILPDGQLGFERDVYGTPVGFKMGDGITHWNDLPYFNQNQSNPLPVNVDIPAGLNYFQTYDYVFNGWSIIFGTKNVGCDIYVKDFDLTNPSQTVFRKSNIATFELLRTGATFSGDISSIWVYLEQGVSNPALTDKDHRLILYKL